jgi:hypothetical protein
MRRWNGMPDDMGEVILGASEPYFCVSATLRIWGDIPDLDGVSRRLGLEPIFLH